MHLELMNILSRSLIDPETGDNLSINFDESGSIESVSSNRGVTWRNEYGIIDFVGSDNYARNFGDQWSRFPKLQLDSFNHTSISRDRFWKAWGVAPDDFDGKIVLDVGCGTGRFAEIALQAGAYVIAVDYSVAARVAAENLQNYERFICFQADLYKLPFRERSFDFVYCLGVLQHTPDVEQAFKSLPPFVKNNGNICVDYYWKRFRTLLGWKYIIRIVTRYFSEKTIFSVLKVIHPIIYPISEILARVPILGKYLSRLLPVVNYRNIYKLSDEELKEWSFLDTYDNWAPRYDQPQNVGTVTSWAQDVDLVEIETLHAGHLVLRAKAN